MARSKVKGTNGKPRKKGTNRDKLKASAHIFTGGETGVHGRNTYKTKHKQYNDGDPHVYHQDTRLKHKRDGSTDATFTKRKVYSKKAANPIKGGVPGVKGLPAISRKDIPVKTTPTDGRRVKKQLDGIAKSQGGTDKTVTTKETVGKRKKKK